MSAEELLTALRTEAVEVSLYAPRATTAGSYAEITSALDPEIAKAQGRKKIVNPFPALSLESADHGDEAPRRESQQIVTPTGAMSRIRILAPDSVAKQKFEQQTNHEPLSEWLASRPDLDGLSFVEPDETRLGFAQADVLRRHSTTFSAIRFFPSTSEPLILEHLERGTWTSRDVPALTQILQTGSEPVRLRYVSILDTIDSPVATEALVRRALYDLSADVREKSVDALACRPAEESRLYLLRGFDHPWQPVTDHAAEALAQVGDRDAIPHLQRLLERRAPSTPFQRADGQWAVRELASVNHLRNCYLCHAPSVDRFDLVRGVVPDPEQSLPTTYYESSASDRYFVRADVTYLRQDFSVVQRVANPEPWPVEQRFDYFVRTRELDIGEARELLAASDERAYRRAIEYAIDQLEQ